MPGGFITVRVLRVKRRERSSGSFAVNQQTLGKMLFKLGDIVGNVIYHINDGDSAKNVAQSLTNIVGNELTVGKSKVDGTSHGSQIVPSFL